jgi:hypothetical protein
VSLEELGQRSAPRERKKVDRGYPHAGSVPLEDRLTYDRIVVVDRSIVAARLTPAAYSNGQALALPEAVVARPEGFEPPTI